MDKKKAIVIAVVLFLLIGLGTFVFANPGQSSLDGNDTSTPGTEVDDSNTDGEEENNESEPPAEEEDDDVISVIGDDEDSNNENDNGGSSNNNGNGNNNNSNNDNGSTVEDNSSYLAALAALEKAENSFLQSDLDYANSLIDVLQDNEDKSDLVNRANVVQEVIDVETLVKNLQNQVNTAQNIDNVNSARNYRADEDIINKVNQLADSSKKEELEAILATVAKILDDKEAPSISGIDDGGVYKEATLEIVEENLHTAEIRKENGRWEDFTSGYKVSESGTYYVKIIDKAYNRLEISFTIDADVPIVDVSYSTTEPTNGYVIVTLTSNEEVEITSDSGTWNPNSGFATKFQKSYPANDTQSVTLTDKVGNSTNVEIKIENIDRVIPEILDIKQEYEDAEGGRIKVTFYTSEAIYGEGIDTDTTYDNDHSIRKVSDTEYYTYYYVTKEVTLNFTDVAGNAGSYTFTVDKTAPTVEISYNYENTPTNHNETVTLKFSEAVTFDGMETWLDKGNNVYQKVFPENTTQELHFKDSVGNPGTLNIEITWIDKEPPEGYNVGILNVTHYREENPYLNYAKVDDEIRVMVYFKEKLETLPILVLNGVELPNEFFYAEQSSNEANNEYVYMADVALTEEIVDQIGLTDGIINFTIKGYADALGNGGAELTNANISENANYPSVEFDSVKPVLNFNNGMITSSFTVEVTEDNFDYMIVKPLNGEEIKVTEKSYEIRGDADNLRYEITVYDKAGNVSDYRSIYLDNQVPDLTVTGYNNGNEVPVENGKKYQKVHVKFTDGSLKKVVLLNENGSEKEVLKTEDNNYYLEKLVYEKTFGEEEGTYIVRAIDRNNQEKTITFTIDKTAPERSAANILEYNADNNLGTYYVTKGDIIHAYVSFDEPLAENPTIVFVNDGKEYVPTKVDQLLPDEKTGKYTYNAYYEVNETDMIDGEVTFKVTNIKDTAGNTTEVSEVTNEHHVYIDRTLIKENWLYFLSANTANRKVVGNGQNLIVEAVFDEEFTSVPKVKIGEGQYADLSCEWMDEKDGWSSRKFVCRNSIITLDNELAKLKNNQIIPIEVTNIVDLAGNETVLTNENIKETAEYGEVTFDGKAPEYGTLRLLKIEPEYGTYAKLGEKIRIIVNFDDVTLAVAPTIRLGNDNNYIIKTMAYDENMKSYTLNYDIIDTELPEGELEIQIYGYADEAGNVGATLTNANINHETQNKVIIDRESPKMDLSKISSTFEVGVDTYVYPQSGIVTDNIDGNISFGEVHMQWFKKTADGEKGEETTCFGGDNWNTGLTNCDLGTYIVTYRVFDKAGNEAYIEKEITLQDTTPATFIPSYYTKNVELDRNGVFNDYPTIEVTDNAPGEVTYKLISDNVDVTKIGDYTLVYQTTDANGNTKTHTIPVRVRDKKAPELVVEDLTNGFTTSTNVGIHAADQSNFKIVVKRDGEIVRDQDPGTLNSNNVFDVWFGLTDAYGDGHFEVIATDEYNNSVTIEFDRVMISLAEQVVGSNPINADGSFGIFNSFAIKFNRDLTFTNYSSTNGFTIEMEYSVDGGKNYKKTGTVVNNFWTETLGDSTTTKYQGSTFTVTAGSPIYWNGKSVQTRYKDIYDAILATAGTENEVYVRTVFTVIQPTYTVSFTLDPVIYSDGGQTVSPGGLAEF